MSERQLWSVGLIWPEVNKTVTFDLSWLLAIGVSQNKLHFTSSAGQFSLHRGIFFFRFIGRYFILITWEGNYF